MGPKEDILTHLLALNHACADKERAGEKITPPGLPMQPAEHAAFITGDLPPVSALFAWARETSDLGIFRRRSPIEKHGDACTEENALDLRMKRKHSTKAAGPKAGKQDREADKLLRWSGRQNEIALNRTLLRIIRYLWKKRGISNHAMARLTGLSRSFVRKLKQQKVELSVPTLHKCCNAIKVDVDGVMELAMLKLRQAVL